MAVVDTATERVDWRGGPGGDHGERGRSGAVGWLVVVPGPLAATAAYVLATGVHLAVAHRLEEEHPPEEER